MSRSTSNLPMSGPVQSWNVWGNEHGQKSRVMIDSSYTQASDPNSMRNKGASRNAVYIFGQKNSRKGGPYQRSNGGRIQDIN